MTELEKMVALFDEIELNYGLQPVTRFYIRWFGCPYAWEGYTSILAAAAVFIFDQTGSFVGVGIGDEQSETEYRATNVSTGR